MVLRQFCQKQREKIVLRAQVLQDQGPERGVLPPGAAWTACTPRQRCPRGHLDLAPVKVLPHTRSRGRASLRARIHGFSNINYSSVSKVRTVLSADRVSVFPMRPSYPWGLQACGHARFTRSFRKTRTVEIARMRNRLIWKV